MATLAQGAVDQYCPLLTCSSLQQEKGRDREHQDHTWPLLLPLPSLSPPPGSAPLRLCCLRTVDVLPLASPRLLAGGTGCCQARPHSHHSHHRPTSQCRGCWALPQPTPPLGESAWTQPRSNNWQHLKSLPPGHLVPSHSDTPSAQERAASSCPSPLPALPRAQALCPQPQPWSPSAGEMAERPVPFYRFLFPNPALP